MPTHPSTQKFGEEGHQPQQSDAQRGPQDGSISQLQLEANRVIAQERAGDHHQPESNDGPQHASGGRGQLGLQSGCEGGGGLTGERILESGTGNAQQEEQA